MKYILEIFFSNHLLSQEHLFPFVMNTCVKNQIFEIMKLQISMLLMAGESIWEYQSPRFQLFGNLSKCQKPPGMLITSSISLFWWSTYNRTLSFRTSCNHLIINNLITPYLPDLRVIKSRVKFWVNV